MDAPEPFLVARQRSMWLVQKAGSGSSRAGHAANQGRLLDEAALAAAMTWSDATREVALPRRIATEMLEAVLPVHCVWTGRRLFAEALDIDHCLPWSAWPCGDLWNLMPAHRTVNQRLKRDRLPSPSALPESWDRIRAWWDGAYLNGGAALEGRFMDEAAASLPALPGNGSGAEQVFAAMSLQRLRPRRDQGVPEWETRPR